MPDESVNTPAASTAQPNLDSMSQPGSTVAAPSTMESAPTPNLTQGNLPAYGEPGAAAQPSTVVPVAKPAAKPVNAGGHTKLLAMVTSLADGLSAAGASLATHGREGGAEMVQQLQSQRQQSKQSAQTAAQAQKNAELQNQLTTGEINRMQSQNYILGQTMHDEVDKSHFATQEAGLGVQQKAQEIFDTTGRVPTGWNADPSTGQVTQGQPSAPGTPSAPVAGTPAAPSMYDRRGAILLDAAGKELADAKGNEDPSVTAARQVFANPASTIEQKQQALIGVQQKAGLSAQVVKNLTEKADLAAKQQTVLAGTRPKDLDDATGRVTAAQQAYKAAPSPTTKAALDSAKNAQSEFMRVDREKKQVSQDVMNGDPTVIGDMLANGTAAPSQVQSARSMSKPFYAQVLARANATAKANGQPEIIGPNGKGTGQYFNEATAESQYQYSKNVQTQNTLNKIRTLNEPGGDLDILKDAVSALPKMDSKTINKIFNASATEFGSPEATNYHMALTNLAGLMAQVQTGAIPTEGEIQTQLGLMNAAYSKGQLDGAIQIARKDIAARGTSMVAKNPFLRNAYPDLAQSQAPATTKAVVINPVTKQPQTIGHTVGETIVQNGQKFTVTSVDGTGKVTGATPAGVR